MPERTVLLRIITKEKLLNLKQNMLEKRPSRDAEAFLCHTPGKQLPRLQYHGAWIGKGREDMRMTEKRTNVLK